MSRRVFISFLGTNNYVPVKYRLGEYRSSQPVRFVQEALIEAVCKNWEKQDAIYIFYTNKAWKMNWQDAGHTESSEGLYSVLKRMNPKPPIIDRFLSEECLEKDIWEIFTAVFNELKAGDQIYFDSTHAFRLIPLFSIPLFNYAHFMKHTDLRAIYYGAFEKLGSAKEVSEMEVNKRIVPIIDLSNLVGLQATSVAASNLVEFGKVGSIAAHEAEPNQDPQLSDSAIAIRTVKQELQKLDDYIETCNMPNIRKGEYIKNIIRYFDKAIRSKSLTMPEKDLLNSIKAQLVEFKPAETDKNIIAAINWAVKYRKVQPVYTLGREYIISKVGELVKQRQARYDASFEISTEKVFREFVGDLLGYNNNRDGVCSKHISGEPDWKAINKFGLKIVQEEWMKKLKQHYETIARNRNALNHASANQSIQSLIDSFKNKFTQCIEIIDEQLNS
jgi:hypothetical protein